MKYDFCVLGVNGLQGTIVAEKLLSKNYKVIGCDKYNSRTKTLKASSNFKFQKLDITDKLNFSLFLDNSNSDIVINCCDMHLNTFVYKQCVLHKKHCIDLGSTIPDTKLQLKLNESFKKRNLIGITGCGSVPGIGNVMVKYLFEKFGQFESINMGFAWDSNIKNFVIPFSLKSILEECTQDPIYVQDKQFVTIKPFEIVKPLELTAVGQQVGFVVHHPETLTLFEKYKNNGLKNIKFFASFPEHSMEKIKFLIDLGFSSHEPIKINDKIEMSPIELLGPITNKLVPPLDYTETETLWVEAFRENKRVLMECVVPPVKNWEQHGCNIDTGFPAAIIAEYVYNNVMLRYGSFSPEEVIDFKIFLKDLQNCGFKFLIDKQPICF